jgi:hypothetical protein
MFGSRCRAGETSATFTPNPGRIYQTRKDQKERSKRRAAAQRRRDAAARAEAAKAPPEAPAPPRRPAERPKLAEAVAAHACSDAQPSKGNPEWLQSLANEALGHAPEDASQAENAGRRPRHEAAPRLPTNPSLFAAAATFDESAPAQGKTAASVSWKRSKRGRFATKGGRRKTKKK